MRVMSPVSADDSGVVANGVVGAVQGDGDAMYRDFSLQVTRTVGASSFTVVIEGSLDGTNFGTLLTHSGTSGDVSCVTGKPVKYWRRNVTSVGAGNTLRVVAIGTGE